VAVGLVGVRDVSIALTGSPLLAWLAEADTNNDDLFYSIRVVEPTPTPTLTETVVPTPSQTPTTTSTATPTITTTALPSPSPTATLQSTWPLFLPVILARSPLTP
jgi:hypothetical protein